MFIELLCQYPSLIFGKELDFTVLRSGESIAYFETQRKHKDGTIKDALASYRAINKGHLLAVAMYKDITVEKVTKHKLEIAESWTKCKDSSTVNHCQQKKLKKVSSGRVLDCYDKTSVFLNSV